MKTPTYMIAVPKCHENLFQIIKDNHEWLAESRSFKTRDKQDISYTKKINNKEDLAKLEKIIQDLRTEKSELFIDDSYHAKPVDMKLEDYISEFLKNKSVGTHYTFRTFYRVTVLPDGASLTAPSQLWNQRQEYLIIPLYIILKKGKTYEQMKTLSYNPDGSFTVNKVNAAHFWRTEPLEEEQITIEEHDEKKRYDELLTSN